MGVFETIFKRPRPGAGSTMKYFQMLTGYAPIFSTYAGGIYEMEATRAAINAIATHCSKLKPETEGSAGSGIGRILQYSPNPFMDTTKFLARLATMLYVHNNAFIVPLEDETGQITGFFPVLPEHVEIVEFNGKPYMRYTFSNGQRAAIEFERVGILTRHQHRDDFFGENNDAMKPTMQLIYSNNQGIVNGIKNSAMIRFLAKINNMISSEDIEKERQRFTDDNLTAENQSGVIMYDAKFADVHEIESKPFTVNAAQMKQIMENVYNYFGVSEAILQNKYNEDEWNAFYEGAVEPFALQLSLVLTNMAFTRREIAHGNAITLTANRLQYASNATKLSITTQLFDRGLLTMNQAMDIWNMAHVEGGDKYWIRKEYAEVSQMQRGGNDNAGGGNEGVPGDGAAAGDSGNEQAV
ncbi:MAG: phage portal protein [Clostridiales bacterium]|nr:phage portal protein [Clostridiales bacterium]